MSGSLELQGPQPHAGGFDMSKDSPFDETVQARDMSPDDEKSDGIDYQDKRELARLGKRPILMRSFRFASILGFTCTIMATWEAAIITLNMGLENGGPGGAIYCFLAAWIGAWCVFASLCELCSMAPTSAGQYYWVSMLAPQAYQKFASYITGWMTYTGWVALYASSAYIIAALIQSLISIFHQTFVPQNWQLTLLIWAVIVLSILGTSTARWLLPKLEGPVLIIHVLGFFGVMLPLAILGPHNDAKDVFASFNNGGGWPTQGLSAMVGILMSVFLFTGIDGAIHMAEETKNASVVIPRSIMVSMALNGALGFGIVVVILFCLHDLDDALNDPTGYAFIGILRQQWNSPGGTAAVVVLDIFITVFANMAELASSSRMFWAFARDKGVPFWRFFVRIDPRVHLPIRCIFVSAVICVLLSLIVIGSPTAFNDIIGLVTSGFYTSYLAAAALLLWRRLSGAIKHPDAPVHLPATAKSPEDAATLINNVGTELYWGPWRIPGVCGVLVNTVACGYLVVALFFSFWPPDRDTSASEMNYNVLVWGAVLLFATVYYWVWGRREYNGPVVEIQGVGVVENGVVDGRGNRGVV